MTHPFRIDASYVSTLDQVQLTKLLQILLHFDLKAHGIVQRAASVALNINVPDGGEDGRVSWNDGPSETDFIPDRNSLFQNKAVGEFGPKACADELVAKDGTVKPKVEEVFSGGGTYVLFTTVQKNGLQITECIDSMRRKLTDLGRPYANQAKIEVYDASKISSWVNQSLTAVVAVSNWTGRPLERGLKTFADWANTYEFQQFPFVSDQERAGAIGDLRKHLDERRACARITGLSGLGKTRLAFEVFKGTNLEKQLVYADASIGGEWIYRLLVDWVQSGIDGVLVVDNCEDRLHNKLKNEVRRTDSKIGLLSLDYNPSDVEDTVVIRLGRLSDDLIKKMLESIYAERIEDLDRIVAFAQGFPQMAVLLANARLSQAQDMGRLNDSEIANKLLWGNEAPDKVEEKILVGCSLFDQFGVDEEAAAEYQFIAERVVAVPPADFYGCIKKYEQRGIIYRRGRYAQLVPKPLAIRLAGEWWRRTRPQDQQSLIESEMPQSLLEGFCSQVSRLDFLPEVKALTEEVCGEQGPFGQAEAILSERGSLLFRSFVGVNPEVTSKSLFRVLKGLDREDVIRIDGSLRRNIVTSLERLCFYSEHYQRAAYSLFVLAEAENESWGNNATGIFKQTFSTFLSGTAAGPETRLLLLDRISADFGVRGRAIVVGALQAALQIERGMRTVGAEYQGFKAPLTEWRPTLWSDAFSYWRACLERLVDLAVAHEDGADLAAQAVAQSIRGLIQYGRVEDVEYAVDRVVSARGRLWPEAVDGIKTSLEYDSKKMPPDAVVRLKRLLDLLNPIDVGERLVLIVSIPAFEHREEGDELIDVASMNAESLAEEFASDTGVLIPHLHLLLSGEQRQAFAFGRKIVNSGGEWRVLLRGCLLQLQRTDNWNISFIIGLLTGIFERSPSYWEGVIEELFLISEIHNFLPYFVASGRPSSGHLHRLIDIFSKEDLDFNFMYVFSQGRVLQHLSADEVSDFVIHLARSSPESAWVALEVGWMYCYANDDGWKTLLPAFASFFPALSVSAQSKKRPLSLHQWSDTLRRLLPVEGEAFAVSMFNLLLNDSLDRIDYSDSIHYVKPVLRQIFQCCTQAVRPMLMDALRRANALDEYLLISLFDSYGRLHQDDQSVLSVVSLEELAKWCREDADVFPSFLARTADAFLIGDGRFDLSPIAKMLLDQFGCDPSVLSGLSAKMGTFSWSGSVIPYYEGRLSVILPLLDHSVGAVREWADQQQQYLVACIKHERVREEEQEFGRF